MVRYIPKDKQPKEDKDKPSPSPQDPSLQNSPNPQIETPADRSALKGEIQNLKNSLDEVSESAKSMEGDSRKDLEQKINSIQNEIGAIKEYLKKENTKLQYILDHVKNDGPVEDKANIEIEKVVEPQEEKVDVKKSPKPTKKRSFELKKLLSGIKEFLIKNKIKIVIGIVFGLLSYWVITTMFLSEYEALVEIKIDQADDEIQKTETQIFNQITTETNLRQAIEKVEELPLEAQEKEKVMSKLVEKYQNNIHVEQNKNNNMNISVKGKDPKKATLMLEMIVHSYLLKDSDEYKKEHYGKILGEIDQKIKEKKELINDIYDKVLTKEFGPIIQKQSVVLPESQGVLVEYQKPLKDREGVLDKKLQDIKQAFSNNPDKEIVLFIDQLFGNVDILMMQKKMVNLEIKNMLSAREQNNENLQKSSSTKQSINVLKAKAAKMIKGLIEEPLTLEMEGVIALFVRQLALEGERTAINLLTDLKYQEIDGLDDTTLAQDQSRLTEVCQEYQNLLLEKSKVLTVSSN